MDITFTEMLGGVREYGRNVMEKNKDRSVTKVLNSTIKSIEKMLKAFDSFLKKNDIDVGKAYEGARGKAKELLEKGKGLFSEAKEKGALKTAKEKGLTLASKASDMFSSFKERFTGPPEEEEAQEGQGEQDAPKKKKSVADKMSGWADKLKARQDKRKQEIEEEKKAVKDAGKAKKGGGWLGKILSGIMSVGSFLLGGIGKIMGPIGKSIFTATRFLGGFLVRGFGKALTSLIPSLSGGIAKTLQGLVGGGLKGAAGLAWSGAKMAARAALPALTSGAGLIGRAALMVATGPVGWAIAAGTALYAGYKLYKYLTRNNVSTDIYGQLTMLRLYTYGFSEANKEYFSKVFDLEMLMKDYIKYSEGRVVVSKLDSEVIEKVLDLFNTTRDDKEKYARLNNWFTRRFMPAYRAFMEALYSVNSKVYLDSLESLKPGDLERFFQRYNPPTSVHSITEIPVDGSTTVTVTKDQIDKTLAGIIANNKKNLPKEQTTADKVQQDLRKQLDQKAVEDKKRVDQSTTAAPPAKPSAPPPLKPEQKGIEGAEGEQKPSNGPPTSSGNMDAKVSGKLNIAGGQLQPGTTTLEGISTKLDKTKILNLDPNVRELFTGMAKEYNALTGKNIPVNEAFRTYQDQVAMAKKYPNKAAKPGTSLHEHGLAIDVNSETVRELDKMGLLRKYGFTTSVGGEAWHLEPIGVSLRPKQAVSDLAFRRSAIEASPGKGGGGFGLQKGSPLGKRNIPLQESIFNSAGGNQVDLSKATGKEDTASKIATGAVPSSKSQFADTKTTPAGNKTNSSGKTSTGVPYQESEPKPSSAPSKSPIQGKSETPSLDKGPGSIPGSGMPANADIAKYANLPPEQAIRQAAKMVGVNEETMVNFAKLESSLKVNAKASTTSASGLFQIVDGTWKELLGKHAKKYGIPMDADKNNPFYNALMAAEYAKANLSKLPDYKGTGLEESTALYMTHRFGTTGGINFIKQLLNNPNAPIENTISKASFDANYNDVKGHTVSSYAAKVAGKFDKAAKTSTAAYTGSKSSNSSGGSSGVMTASSSGSGATKPTTAAYNPSSSSGSSRPSISNARYETASVTPAATARSAPPTPTPTAHSEMFNTSKMEGLMSDQLTKLTDIATVLNAMNSKLDMEKLVSAISSVSKTPTPPPTDKSVPDTSVNLSRKKLA